MALRGKCRHCRKAISWQYPIVELMTGVLFVLAWQKELGIMNNELSLLNLDSIIQVLRDWIIISVMIVIFIYDLRWYLILDVVTLPTAVALFILNIILGFSWLSLLLYGIIGASFFLIQFVVSKGKWIGGGDIRLGLLMGLALGKFSLLILAIMLAYFIGSIVGVGLILAGQKKWGSKLPLGVFLSSATIIVLLWGEQILSWYLGLV